MKISNLILTFILALAVSYTVHGQSNSTREISIENDDESIYIKFKDGELKKLKIGGSVVQEKDYDQYADLLNKYKNPSEEDLNHHQETGTNAELHHAIKAYLIEKTKMNRNKYKFKLTPDYIKVNGKKMDRETLSDCLDIYEKHSGTYLPEGSYFRVDISPNSRSISLSIQD